MPPDTSNLWPFTQRASSVSIAPGATRLALIPVVSPTIPSVKLPKDWRFEIINSFVGSLKSQDVRRIDLNEAGQIVGQSSLRIGQRMIDVLQGTSGLICALTDESNGSLIGLEPVSDKESPRSALNRSCVRKFDTKHIKSTAVFVSCFSEAKGSN